MRRFNIHIKSKPIIFPFILTLVLVSGLLYFEKRATNAQTTSSTWYMAGANPQRSSWISQDVTTVTGIEWYRPIEAYIEQGTQIVTGNGKIYISTTKGLVVLDAENGDIRWRFDTEMPLGNAPTIIGDMVYVAGYDRKLYGIRDLGSSGRLEWTFSGAKAGYSTNPVVVNGTVYLGSRDGYFYAVNANNGNLTWQYPQANQEGLGTIEYSAAFDDNTLYFASNNMYAYALNASTGQLVWRSPSKLPGEKFQSWWPVVFQDYVIFSSAPVIKHGSRPGTLSLGFNNIKLIDAASIYDDTGTGTAGTIVTSDGSQGWPAGARLMDSTNGTGDMSISEYLSTYPDRRTVVALQKSNGSISTVPALFTGTRSGTRYPPIVDPNETSVYFFNSYMDAAIPRSTAMAWKPGNNYFQLITARHFAHDEPNSLSGAGANVMYSLCCDRSAGLLTTNRVFWDYPGTLDSVLPFDDNDPNQYDPMWNFYNGTTMLERLAGYYRGTSTSRNGIYHNHGQQNPLVPYVFTNSSGQRVERMFIHRSNTIVALGNTNSKRALRFVEINRSPQNVGTTLNETELRSRLEKEIRKMLDTYDANPQDGFLKPGYVNDDATIAGWPETFYFDSPGDTLGTLSIAYSFINDASLKSRLATYLQDYYNRYFSPTLYAKQGWATGQPREDLVNPPEILESMATLPDIVQPTNGTAGGPGNSMPMRSFYSVWKYVQLFPSQASNAYSIMRPKLPYPSNLTLEDMTRSPYKYNDFIAGYIGFLNLQEAVFGGNYSTADATLRQNVQNELTTLLTLRNTYFTKDHPWLGSADNPDGILANSYNRKYNAARNFMYMVPELANYLKTNNLEYISEALNEYTYLLPFWFVPSTPNAFQENVSHPMYDVPTLFQAQAFIMSKSQAELSKYIDVPGFARGDLYYIQNLYTALGYNGSNIPVPPTDPEPPPPPPPGPVGPLTISGVTRITTGDIGANDKFELAFDVLNSRATNFDLPYDVAAPAGVDGSKGITVNVQYSPDNWTTTYTQPAFYYQKFDDQLRGQNEWFYPLNDFEWRSRFSPPITGTWRYRITAQDSSGTAQSQQGQFNVIASTNKGFLKVSLNDPRYFEFSDGTYFPGLGYNMNFNHVDWTNPINANQTNFQTMAQNNIQLVRVWLSQWGIYGSAWNPWNSIVSEHHSAYIPFTGLTAVNPYTEGSSETSMVVNAAVNRCMFSGWLKARPAVKRNTNYRVAIRYKTENITGPRNASSSNYGLAVKLGDWLNNCDDAGTGTVVTPYQNQNTIGTETEWRLLEGNWNSGSNDFLPYLYITVENANTGRAVIDYVWVQEVNADSTLGANVIYKPWMSHHLYFDQRNSYAFDKVLDLAKQNNVYLRPVLLEQNEWIADHIQPNGTMDDAVSNTTNFYGDYRNNTKGRWLQKAWWRYVQARWGYSPNIHSWELLNEGDPASGRHFALADELGAYMKQFAPNNHMVSTSTWHSFPASEFWGNASYPNIDFADLHQYIDRSTNLASFNDTALASYSPGINRRAALVATGFNKPIIRGETGFTETGSEPGSASLLADTDGTWLHNFVWAGLNPGGMIESYWYENYHIYNPQSGFDHRPIFKTFYNFISDIPLNNGNYVDAGATIEPTNATLRAWGQKDIPNDRAHLWINNSLYNWTNENPAPVTGSVSLIGFAPYGNYIVENWDTYTGAATGTTEVTASDSGVLTISVTALVKDFAVKIARNSENPGGPPPAGTSFYVSPNGNDAGPGTLFQPWKTIQKAVNTLQPGNTVYIRGGTYPERVIINTTSGTENNYISLEAYEGETPIINGAGISITPSAGLIDIRNVGYIRIKGLRVINSDDAGIYAARANHLQIIENSTRDTNSSGIGIWSSDQVIVDGNNVVNARNVDMPNGHEESITIATTTNFEVKNNEISLDGVPHYFGNEAIDAKDGSRFGSIHHNYVHDFDGAIYVDAWQSLTGNIDIYSNRLQGPGASISIGSERGGTTENINIYNNIITNTTWAGIVLHETGINSGGNGLRRNINIYNNSIYRAVYNGGAGIYIVSENVENITIRNNIVYMNNSNGEITAAYPSILSKVNADHNLVFGPKVCAQDRPNCVEISNNPAGYPNIHSNVTADPQFIDTVGMDLRLQSTSPAIDAGVNTNLNIDFGGTSRPQGTAYDIGAYEFLGTPTPPPPPPTNLAPIVNAGSDLTATTGVARAINGSATDDGLPNNTLTYTWTYRSGPSTPTFSTTNQASTNVTFNTAGTYVLRLTANDSLLSSFDEVTIVVTDPSPVNQAPVVNAGSDLTATTGVARAINGSATDDGLPNNALTLTWTYRSGPSTPTFSTTNQASTNVTFNTAGTYVLRLTANDSLLSSFDEVTIVVTDPSPPPPTNQAPTVNVGSDITTNIEETVNLTGAVTDDGLPSNTLNIIWTTRSGTGTVTYGNRNSAATTATFSVAGTYVLRLTANDTALASYDELVVTVEDAPPEPEPTNLPPAVNAGEDKTGTVNVVLNLVGIVTDDGLPQGVLSYEWSSISGPSSPTISSPASISTDVTFGTAGTYILRLTATDSQLTTSDDLTITISAPAGGGGGNGGGNGGGGGGGNGGGGGGGNDDDDDDDDDNNSNPKGADFNGDGVINVFDLGIFAGNYGKRGTICDLNGDGTVNVFDLGIFAGKYGTRP